MLSISTLLVTSTHSLVNSSGPFDGMVLLGIGIKRGGSKDDWVASGTHSIISSNTIQRK